MEATERRKVTVKVTYNAPSTSSRPPSRTNSPRPPSPIKFSESSGPTTTFRPKAKVNSSATVRKSPSVVSVTPRPGSPTKLAKAQNGTLSPTFQPRVVTSVAANKTIGRPQTPVSAPGTSDVRRTQAQSEVGKAQNGTLSPTFQPRIVTSVATNKTIGRPQTPVSAPGTPDVRRTQAQSEVGKNPNPRVRDGGASLHHTMSFSSLQTAAQEKSISPPALRIRSKVSNISRASSENPSPSSLHPSPRLTQARVRSPSTSSNVSQMTNTVRENPLPQFYPITTATSAANPHRYNQNRPTTSPTSGHHVYQGLALLNGSQTAPRARVNSIAKVDIAAIPPPPLSPPISALSFSSRSSVSQSSTSHVERRRESSATATDKSKSVPDLNIEDSPEEPPSSGRDSVDSDLKVKAAAKSDRKIADLEITNRSLLSINATLEATKNKQMKEIRELRRKLRESRLILPPRAYRAYKSSVGPEEEEEEEAADDEDDDSEVENAAEGDGDEIYKRVKLMIENLITSGKKALETKIEDFPEGGKKVLTAEEVQSWHRSNQTSSRHDNDSYSELESDADMSQTDISTTSSVNGNDDDDNDDHEDGGVISFLSQITFPRSTGPPIHISEA